MDKRCIHRPRLLAMGLALTISLAACGGGSPVTLKYISPGGPDNCYLPAFEGELVSDPTAVTVFNAQYGLRMPVLWPAGWTGRTSGSEVEVLDPRGTVVARTGTSFYPSGGLDADGNWEMCDQVLLPPAG
jgi:hypothetical protein